MWVDHTDVLYPRIKGERIDISGVKVGAEYIPPVGEAHFNPKLIYNARGDEYLYVFENKEYGTPDRVELNLIWRYFVTNTFYGHEFIWDIPYDEYQPDTAYNPVGNSYDVVWEVAFSPTDHDVFMGLIPYYGQGLFRPIGPIIVSNTASWEGNPAVASSDGAISLVVWEDQRNAGNGTDIYAAIVNHGRIMMPFIRK